jgi:hypothetical protein
MDISKVDGLIYVLRGERVMMDRDIAELYGVGTKVLNQAVRRHLDRFPKDFMFQLTSEETENWKSQIVTSNSAVLMGLRKRPLAFTEQGVAMLSSVLNTQRAIGVNIAIMRVFVRFRRVVTADSMFSNRLDKAEQALAAIEREQGEHAVAIHEVFAAFRRLGLTVP